MARSPSTRPDEEPVNALWAGDWWSIRYRPVPVVAAAALALVAGGYAIPRLADLARVPAKLDTGLAAAARYNPGLAEVVRLESATAAHLDEMDNLRGGLDRLRASVAGLGPQLAAMVPNIERLTAPLGQTVDETAALALALAGLERELGALEPRFSSSAATLVEAQRLTANLLADLGTTAAEVRRASAAATGAAANVAGPARP